MGRPPDIHAVVWSSVNRCLLAFEPFEHLIDAFDRKAGGTVTLSGTVTPTGAIRGVEVQDVGHSRDNHGLCAADRSSREGNPMTPTGIVEPTSYASS
jgi:hypothetical protein